MREILFRGRQKGGTEWFFGDLSYLVHDKQKCYIFPPDGYNSPDWYEVDPSTISQFTGLTDKNGKKIFEGDIVKHRLVLYESVRTGIVEYSDNFGAFFIVGSGYSDNQMYAFCDYEVIGNKWDNPELLKEGHE